MDGIGSGGVVVAVVVIIVFFSFMLGIVVALCSHSWLFAVICGSLQSFVVSCALVAVAVAMVLLLVVVD